MKNIFYCILVSLVFISCVSKTRERKLLKKISELEDKLELCENGADKLHAKMKLKYQEKVFDECKLIYAKMLNTHPESDQFKAVKKLYNKIIKHEKRIALQDSLKKVRDKQRKLKSLKKLKRRYDDVSGTYWYKNPYFTHYNNTNLTSIYFGVKNKRPWLRLQMSYKGSNWIFFEKAYLSIDGNTKQIYFDRYDNKETENDGGEVWEWIDVSVSDDLLTFLKTITTAKKVKMRLSGKYTETRTLTWKERQGIKDVLNGYETIKSNIN